MLTREEARLLEGEIVEVNTPDSVYSCKLQVIQEEPNIRRPNTCAFRAAPLDGDHASDLVIKIPFLPDGASDGAAAEFLEAQFRQEQEIMDRLREVDSVPAAISCKVRLLAPSRELKPCTVRRYVEGVPLNLWFRSYAEKHGHGESFRGLNTSEEWFHLARRLIAGLERIHQERVFHGDLRPENIILSAACNTHVADEDTWDKVWFVNVEEEGAPLHSLRELKAAGVFRRKYDAPSRLFEKSSPDAEPVQRNASAEWYAPADIFSLGAILLELACGRKQDLKPFLYERESGVPGWNQVLGFEKTRTDRQLKNFVLDALRSVRQRATCHPYPLKHEDILRMTEVIMACVRTQTETQSSDLRNVSTIVDQFAPVDEPDVRPGGRDSERELRTYLNNMLAGIPAPLRPVMQRRAETLIRDVGSIRTTGVLRVAGSRGHFVDVFITLLRNLGPGSQIRALTTPTFFFDGNMGPYGRVTSALQLAHLRGVSIEWIIVVNEKGLRDRKVCEVLEAQKQVMQDVSDVDRENPGIRYSVVSPVEYAAMLRQKATFIELKPRANNHSDTVLIAPDYRGEAGSISVIRLWAVPGTRLRNREKRRHDLEQNFAEYARRARPMHAFTR
jgi:serine/threonine protein kinase